MPSSLAFSFAAAQKKKRSWEIQKKKILPARVAISRKIGSRRTGFAAAWELRILLSRTDQIGNPSSHLSASWGSLSLKPCPNPACTGVCRAVTRLSSSSGGSSAVPGSPGPRESHAWGQQLPPRFGCAGASCSAPEGPRCWRAPRKREEGEEKSKHLDHTLNHFLCWILGESSFILLVFAFACFFLFICLLFV